MPQRPTTYKDLHRAAIGSAFSLVYLFAIPGGSAQNPPHTVSAGVSTKSDQGKLVKNAPAKPIASPAGVMPVAEVKPAQTKTGKLREIPLSTLNGDKAVSTQSAARVEAKPGTKPSATVDSASGKKTDSASGKKTESSASQNTDSTQANKKVSVTTKKTVTTKVRRTTVSAPRLNNGLIPPPPPIVPIGMDVLGMYAQPVDYLSMKDLEARKKELSVRFNELDSVVSDGQRQIKERKERAELFESLYQEGVVSRKELEIAKRESGEIDRDFKFKQDELESVKVSMKAVNNRLAVLKKMEAKMHPGKQKEKKTVAAGKVKGTQRKQ